MMTNSEMGEKIGEKQFIQIGVYKTWHMLGMMTNSEKGTENQDKLDLDVCTRWWQILEREQSEE